MSKVFLSAHAASDLETIADFIAKDSVREAERMLDCLDDKLKTISLNPTIGRERPNLWRGVLCFVVGRQQWRSRYLIFYRQIENGIEVARIIEGHRNIAAALLLCGEWRPAARDCGDFVPPPEVL